MKKTIIVMITLAVCILSMIQLTSCDKSNPIDIVQDIVYNKVTAKDRIDSAYAQATRKYGNNTKLVLILGRNVIYSGTDAGRTDISITTAASDPNSLGAWIYVFKKPNTDTLAVYTPDPTPGERDCIELTSIFNINTLLSLIPDTSARNIIQGTIQLVNSIGFEITTPTASLINSDAAFNLSYSTNPIIKFDNLFATAISTTNGDKFFNQDITNATKSVNMFLIPGLGTLNLPNFVQNLTGFPPDLWVVNYKKLYTDNTEKNLILGTVVQNSQIMNILTLISSKVINLSKYVQELP